MFRSIVAYLACIIFFSLVGCQSLKPVKMPQGISVPDRFGNDYSDSSKSMGYIPWRQFFTDTNLTKLIDTAIVRNFDLQRAIQNIQMANADLYYNRRRYLPVINIGGNSSVEKYGDYTMNGVGNYYNNLTPNIETDRITPNPTPDFFLGLRSTWEIGLWGKYKNTRKAAFNRFLASKKGRDLVMTALVAEVANLYYELLALDNELITLRKNIDLQQTALETVQELKKGAMSNELAVKQFKSNLLSSQGLEIRKRQDIIKAENMLNLLLGRLPGPIQRGRPIREQTLPENIQIGIPSTMLIKRPDIQQAELELEAARLNVKVARAALFPNLSLSAYVGLNAFNAALLFSSPASLAYGVLGSVFAPLINRSASISRINRTKAQQLDAFFSYQKTIANGFQEVVTNLNGIRNYQEVYDLKYDEVNNIQGAVAVSKDLFKAGYASYLEIITVQKSLLQAELELTEVKKEQFFYVIELYRSLGGGWE